MAAAAEACITAPATPPPSARLRGGVAATRQKAQLLPRLLGPLPRQAGLRTSPISRLNSRALPVVVAGGPSGPGAVRSRRSSDGSCPS